MYPLPLKRILSIITAEYQ